MSYHISSTPIEPRAGLVPYYRNQNGDIEYLTMIASSPKYGGRRPMVSKGKIEDGETTLAAAFREAEEELGFKLSNAAGPSFKIADEHVHLRSANYHLTLYAVEVISKYDFKQWGYETGSVVWLTLDEFRTSGRADHLPFLIRIEDKLRAL